MHLSRVCFEDGYVSFCVAHAPNILPESVVSLTTFYSTAMLVLTMPQRHPVPLKTT